MHAVPFHSNSSAMPIWFTIDEVVNIINQQVGVSITDSEVWRCALYGQLTLSIYFQSPIKLRRIKSDRNKIYLMKCNDDPVSQICYLNRECLIRKNHWVAKTEGNYVSPSCHIIDAPLFGIDLIELQKQLARSLLLPHPQTGQGNIHYGLIVRDESGIWQVFENLSFEERINHQLNGISSDDVTCFYNDADKLEVDWRRIDYFPVYHFPEDACFVVKRKHLETFINTCFPSSEKVSSQISTPVSRFLWLACKHNELINSLIDHPYKLVSVFEEWAASDGITDRLSGDTLKKALQRGSPF